MVNRKRTKKAKEKNGNPVDGQATTVFVRYLGTYTNVITGSSQFSQTLHPLNLGSRAVEFCDLFEEFRFVDVKVSFLSSYSSATTNPVMTAWGISSTENLTAAPTTALQITQYETSHVTFLNQTRPVEVKLPQTVMRGFQPWYSANSATDAPAIWSVAGMSISTGLAVAGTVQILWEARIQFKGNSDPSVSVSRRLLRERAIADDFNIEVVSEGNLPRDFRPRATSAPPATKPLVPLWVHSLKTQPVE